MPSTHLMIFSQGRYLPLLKFALSTTGPAIRLTNRSMNFAISSAVDTMAAVISR